MNNPFIKNHELLDNKIVQALRKAADDYENGELLEVADVLAEIRYAIIQFSEDEPLVHDECLDNTARMYGVKREDRETDRQLKHKTLNAIEHLKGES